MSFRLCDGLSFCRVDEHVVFLDIPNDRYFELPASLEAIFLAYVGGSDGDSDLDLNSLVDHRILTKDPVVGPHIAEPALEFPRRSVFEHGAPDDANAWQVMLEVLAIICWTQLRLKTGKLENVLRDVIRHRDHAAPPLSPQPSLSRVMHAAAAFGRARRYTPIDTCCLLDSLSMITFLARRKLVGRIVFGVVRNPFSAHCWVQSGDVVLNDTVGDVSNHTRILIV